MVSLSLVQSMDPKNGSNPRELEQLLARIAAGEQEALAQLYSRTRGAVYALALSYLKNPHDAQDTTQDTYVQVWENAEKYRPQGSPMAWLLTIARNRARLRLRQAGRQESLEHQEWEAIPAGEEGVSPEDRHLLQEALAALGEQERQIILLHSTAGLRHREIAALLELPLPTVLSKYHRALKKLKKQMEVDDAR